MTRLIPIAPRLNISRNVQVTHSQSFNNARSESVVSINPQDSQNLICASKRFRNIRTYDFVIEPSYSLDGGRTWTPTPLQLHRDWGQTPGMSDPTIAWDSRGWAYLFVGPHWKSLDPTDAVGEEAIGIGVWVYRSRDGGRTWLDPVMVSGARNDDKQWAASDTSVDSPHFGNVYVAWGANTPLHFGRSRNPGIEWHGPGTTSPQQSSVAPSTFAPEISVGPDGTIYVVWHMPGSSTIELVTSSDGGQTFAPQRSVVRGMTSITGSAPSKLGWPHLPGGTFRVLTLATACVVGQNTLMVAWADYRDGVSRIYYRRSPDGGVTWEGPESGQPLLTGEHASGEGVHEFHPQIVATRDGTVGCAFYEFAQRGRLVDGQLVFSHLIDVVFAASRNAGAQFTLRDTVTDRPWNPRTNAPWAHGKPEVTFIGEYFGLDCDDGTFHLVWTDTRTGMQELFAARVYVQTFLIENDPLVDSDTVFIPLHGSEGVIGFNRKTGKVVPLPYPQWREVIEALALPQDPDLQQAQRLIRAYSTIETISPAAGRAVKPAIVQSLVQMLGGEGGEPADLALTAPQSIRRKDAARGDPQPRPAKAKRNGPSPGARKDTKKEMDL